MDGMHKSQVYHGKSIPAHHRKVEPLLFQAMQPSGIACGHREDPIWTVQWRALYCLQQLATSNVCLLPRQMATVI